MASGPTTTHKRLTNKEGTLGSSCFGTDLLFNPQSDELSRLKKRARFYKPSGIRRYPVQAIFKFFYSYRAQRNPMLLFVFVGPLFKFNVSTPAFVSLFQFPPRMKAFHYTSPVPIDQKTNNQIINYFYKFIPSLSKIYRHIRTKFSLSHLSSPPKLRIVSNLSI